MTYQDHPLFQAYPLTGEREISVGTVPTPYQTYDGNGMFIGGTADISTVNEILASERLYPYQNASGRALVGLWVVDFTDASLGPHTELQVSILASHQPTDVLSDHPLHLLKALLADEQARMFCYGLWNNTEKVVAYNREMLGLNAQLNSGSISHNDNSKTFEVMADDERMICSGSVSVAKRTAPNVGWSFARLLGFRNTIKAFTQSYLGAKVVNPISDDFPFNGDAQSFVASDTPILQFWNHQTDTLSLNAIHGHDIDFEPSFIEHFSPFRFVYLEPEKA